MPLHPLDMVLRGGLNGPPFFMFMRDIEELKSIIRELAVPLVKAQGLIIWGLEVGASHKSFVRLYVDLPTSDMEVPVSENSECQTMAAMLPDKPWNPVFSPTIEQCETISRQLGMALDVRDCIPSSWILEISTPGLERKFFELSQMRPYVGDLVEAELYASLPGAENRRMYRGRLVEVGDRSFTIQPAVFAGDGSVLEESSPLCSMEWSNVRKARRIHVFEIPEKPGKGRNAKKKK